MKNRMPFRVFLGTLLLLASATLGFTKWDESVLRRGLLPIADVRLAEYEAHARIRDPGESGGALIMSARRLAGSRNSPENTVVRDEDVSENEVESVPAQSPPPSAPPGPDGPRYDVVSTVGATRQYVLFGEVTGNVILFFRGQTPDGLRRYSAVDFLYSLVDGEWVFTSSGQVGHQLCREAAIKAFGDAESDAG